MAGRHLKTDQDKFNFWTSSNSYAFAIIGWGNTFMNAHTFPELFHKYGRMQVLLPYLLISFAMVVPLVFCELAIGQYTNNGFVNMWRMAPLFRGLAWSTATITFFASNCALFTTTHAGYYLLKSFETSLPWSKCDVSWSGRNCYNAINPVVRSNFSGDQNSVEHFYRSFVLSETALSFSEVNLRLFLLLVGTLILCAMLLIERTKSVERLLNGFVFGPFVLLLALTMCSLLNRSELTGLELFVTPDVSAFMNYQMWADVANNALATNGLAMGGLLCIAAHGNFRSNIYTMAIFAPLYNLLTDVLFTLFVYSTFINYAAIRSMPVEEMFSYNASLLFVKMPMGLLEWPAHKQLWSIVYFVYLYMIGARHFLFLLFALTSGFHETFHCVFYLRRFAIGVLCFMVLFVMPLYIAPIGYAMYVEMESFCNATFLTFIAFLETIAIFYIYGARRLIVDVHFMLNKKIKHLEYLLCLIPIALCALSLVNFHQWAWAPRDYKVRWIFILQIVVLALMIGLFLLHLIIYALYNWDKKYGWIMSPSNQWGCSSKDMKRNREFFKSATADARFTYRQELYERTIAAME